MTHFLLVWLKLGCYKKNNLLRNFNQKFYITCSAIYVHFYKLIWQTSSKLPWMFIETWSCIFFHSKNPTILSIFLETSLKLEIWMFLETGNKGWQTICSSRLLECSLKVVFFGNIQLFLSNFSPFLETSLN